MKQFIILIILLCNIFHCNPFFRKYSNDEYDLIFINNGKFEIGQRSQNLYFSNYGYWDILNEKKIKLNVDSSAWPSEIRLVYYHGDLELIDKYIDVLDSNRIVYDKDTLFLSTDGTY